MLATLGSGPFDREGWIFEIKHDGYRAIAQIGDGKVELYSRNLLSFNSLFGEIVSALRALSHQAVLDGEVVAVDASGRSRFQYLQHYREKKKGTLLYYVFDILYLDGEDLRSRPLIERKEILKQVIPEGSLVRYSEHVEKNGQALFEAAVEKGLEGIIGKNGESRYATGMRSPDWVKIKTELRQEAVIAGFTAPRGSRKKIGALVLGAYEDGELRYIGHTGTGFNEQSISEAYKKLLPLKIPRSPFNEVPKTNMPVTWVRPDLVAEIRFSEWTDGGSMRHPVFLGLRPDKPAKEVVRELASRQASGNKPRATRAKDGGGDLGLTNLDKIYWPKDGYTKGDLIDYYRQVAPVMLPHLKDRPESLNRHPDGILGESFYQKNIKVKLPSFAQTVKLRSESEDRTINWLLCQNEKTLLYMANLGCIEINPWNSRYTIPDRPDYLIIDLDPDEANTFEEVVEVALVVRRILEKAEVQSYPKTSGKSGLHVVVPLKAKYSHDEARMFGEIIANLVNRKLPSNTSVIRDPKKRKGKIYLDYLQNRIGQTIAAPYSARPWPGATVSAPLEWREVTKKLHPGKFTIKNMPARINKKGDLWCPVKEKSADLERALRNLQK